MIQKKDIVVLEAIRLLEMGKRVTLPVNGKSMLPFILGGIESVELVKENGLKVGDIVLAWVNNAYYVVHRIVQIKDCHVCLMGDGNLRGVEHCLLSDVAAKADYIVDCNGIRHYLYTPQKRLAAFVWRILLPIRRWLLAIYRRTYLKLRYNEN